MSLTISSLKMGLLFHGVRSSALEALGTEVFSHEVRSSAPPLQCQVACLIFFYATRFAYLFHLHWLVQLFFFTYLASFLLVTSFTAFIFGLDLLTFFCRLTWSHFPPCACLFFSRSFLSTLFFCLLSLYRILCLSLGNWIFLSTCWLFFHLSTWQQLFLDNLATLF